MAEVYRPAAWVLPYASLRGSTPGAYDLGTEALMDEDIAGLSRDEMADEIRRLRDGIRKHRDSSGQDLCWHHPALWGLLPEKTDPLPVVPEWPAFLRGCVHYRESLDRQVPDAPRTTEEGAK